MSLTHKVYTGLNIKTVSLIDPEVNVDEDIDQEDSEQIQVFSEKDS